MQLGDGKKELCVCVCVSGNFLAVYKTLEKGRFLLFDLNLSLSIQFRNFDVDLEGERISRSILLYFKV